jgi:hypothetical protein
MLFQLEVKDGLQEHAESQFVRIFCHIRLNLTSAHLLISWFILRSSSGWWFTTWCSWITNDLRTDIIFNTTILNLLLLELSHFKIYLTLKLMIIIIIIHLFNNLSPLPVIYGIIDYGILNLHYLIFRFLRIFLSDNRF